VDYSKHIGSTDWDIPRNLADMRNTGLRAHFYTLRQSFRTDQEYELAKIHVPTVILHGEKDSMVPKKNVLQMTNKIPNALFINIQNVDHNTAHNAVKEISTAIEDLIQKNRVAFS
jgi:pimeloyl-ACP methyl ester carboxylesterase